MLLFLNGFVYNELVKELLSLNFVWRVAPYELWKFHFEDPVDVQVVEDDVKDVSLGALGVIHQIVQELQQVFRLHHSVEFISLEVAYQLDDAVDGSLGRVAFVFDLFSCLNVVAN